MKEIYSNVTIIGGGLIGVASALALSKLGLKVTILEHKPIYQKRNNQDTRTIAISEGTKNFLNKLGVWVKLQKYSEPIKAIKIIDRDLSNNLDFDNSRRTSNLGYIIKNRIFLDIFYKEINKIKQIKVYNNISIQKLEKSDFSQIYTQKFLFKSDLCIAADGKKSSIKNLLKINDYKKNYNKKALVTTFEHTKSHENTAYEFFFRDGPLAILPMQKEKNKFISSIVWTNKNNFIDMLSLNENKILSLILTEKTNKIIGDIKKIITKQAFPISAHVNSSFHSSNTIFIGDSAHSFHPIAGQGWNLGMKDVETLFELSKTYLSLGIEVGGENFCKDYHDNSYFRAYRLFQLTDKLDNLFLQENIFFKVLRSSGLKIIKKNQNIKNKISDFAMGF